MGTSNVSSQAGGLSYDLLRYYPRLERLERYVRANIARDITLAEAAELVGLQRKYFSAYFRRATGMKFQEWLARMRLDMAVQLMVSRDASITEVAFASGFGDLRNFERWFARVIGSSPRDFRASIRSQRIEAGPVTGLLTTDDGSGEIRSEKLWIASEPSRS